MNTENTEVDPNQAASEKPQPTKDATAGAKRTYEVLEQEEERAIADNVKLRSKNTEYKARIAELETQARKAAELEDENSKLKLSHRAELAMSKLEALAVKEGLTDLDLLKLLDLSKVDFDENGKPKNLAKVLSDFRDEKPSFFGSVSNTSTIKVPQGDAKAAEENVSDMSKEEFAAYRAGIRRKR